MRKVVVAAISVVTTLLILVSIIHLGYVSKIPLSDVATVITISSNGSIQSKLNSVPIAVNGKVYTLTGDLNNCYLDIQCSNIVFNGSDYWITGNLHSSSTGIKVEANQVDITNVNVEGFSTSISISGSYNTVTQIHSNITEIDVAGNNNAVTENNITRGLVSLHGNYNIISDNILYSTNVDLWGTNFTTIKGNTFYLLEGDNTTCDICMYGSKMESNVVFLNNFMSKIRPMMYTDPQNLSKNRFDNGSVGNYWSDYSIKNPNAKPIGNTGIYDTRYCIGGSITDYYPLTTPYHLDVTIRTLNSTPPPLESLELAKPDVISPFVLILALTVVPVFIVAVSLLLYKRHRKNRTLNRLTVGGNS